MLLLALASALAHSIASFARARPATTPAAVLRRAARAGAVGVALVFVVLQILLLSPGEFLLLPAVRAPDVFDRVLGELPLVGIALAFGVVVFGQAGGATRRARFALLFPCALLGACWGVVASAGTPFELVDEASYRLGLGVALGLASFLALPIAELADRFQAWWCGPRLASAPVAAPAPVAPELEPVWDDHLAPLRGLARLLFGGALRVALGALAFAPLCLAPTLVLETLTYEESSYRRGVVTLREGLVAELALAALLALSLGALRLIEVTGRVVRPEQSYARKLAMGVLVAGLSFLAVYALLLQLHYVSGLVLGGGTLAAGLGGIAARGSLLGSRSDGELWGIALAFGLTGFGRARGLPLREQVALVGVFGLLWISKVLVYEGTLSDPSFDLGSSHDYELLLWVTAWVSILLVPALARAADALEPAWMPRRLRAVATP